MSSIPFPGSQLSYAIKCKLTFPSPCLECSIVSRSGTIYSSKTPIQPPHTPSASLLTALSKNSAQLILPDGSMHLLSLVSSSYSGTIEALFTPPTPIRSAANSRSQPSSTPPMKHGVRARFTARRAWKRIFGLPQSKRKLGARRFISISR